MRPGSTAGQCTFRGNLGWFLAVVHPGTLGKVSFTPNGLAFLKAIPAAGPPRCDRLIRAITQPSNTRIFISELAATGLDSDAE